MTPEQIKKHIAYTSGQIIGLKKEGRRKFGTSHKGSNCAWPAEFLERLEMLKATVKDYQALLEQNKETTG